MKILLHTDLPFNNSAYGQQGYFLAQMMRHAGHDVSFVARGQAIGTPCFEFDGFEIFHSFYYYDGIQGAIKWSRHLNADMTISLTNSTHFKKEHGGMIKNWFPYFPVEREPIESTTIEAIKMARMPLAMSHHGMEEYRKIGVNAFHLPHCIDTSIFKPGTGIENEQFKGKFVVGMVAANRSSQDRKGFDVAFDAFANFRKSNPNSVFYCHSDKDYHEGINLVNLAEYHGLIEGHDIFFTPEMDIATGYSSEMMARLYNTMDVLVMPSRAEGFGIPLIEAQACGTPVIATNYAAMTENVFSGYLLPYRPVLNANANVTSREALPYVEYLQEKLQIVSEDAVKYVPHQIKQFDYTEVYKNNLLPLLEFVEKENNCEHVWSGITLHTGFEDLHSCEKCTSALVWDGNLFTRSKVFTLEVNGMPLKLVSDEMNKIITYEMRSYNAFDLDIKPGDVIVDIGAHVGIFSLAMALTYPQAKIWAYEPVRENYKKLVENIKLNGVENITAMGFGVTKDGRDIVLDKTSVENSGSYRSASTGVGCKTVRMSKVMSFHPVLLKIDCEGFEKELLIDSGIGTQLKDVKYIRGELHKEDESKQIIDFVALHIDDYKWSTSYG